MIENLRLGDSLEVLIDHRGKTPKKLGSDFSEVGVPVASAILVKDGVLDIQGARRIPVDVYRRWMSVPTRRGDVLLTSEAPLGRVAQVPNDDPLVLGQRLYGLRGRKSVLDNGYLFYALQTDRVQADLVGRSTGTTVFGIRQSALVDLVIPAPQYRQQVAIAEVLGALDDKIAANTKLASTADELVRSWYERTTSQASAMTSVGSLAAQVRDLVDPTEVGVGEIYVGLEHVPRRHMWLNDAGVAGSVTSTKAAFRANDVLFGKLRPYFHKVVAAPVSGVSSTDILVLRARESLLAGYLLAVAASDQVVERCTAASEGTRMPRTSWADLAAIEVPWPGDEEARRLSARVVELRSRVEAALVENHTLAATRDTLLPQLMSGKLRVRDAERVVSEVA